MQQPAPTPPPPQQPPPPATPAGADVDDEIVRITTNLVQVDAVVLGRDGRQVTDLRAEDFEVFEDGRPQAITNFSYVDTAPAASATAPAQPGVPTPPATRRARREQVRRTIAVVVDDLGMAFENVPHARRALRKFIDERVEPGDLVAVIRTGGEVGALQQFTTDKRQMRAAVERVRWNSCSRRGIRGGPGLSGGFTPLCSRGSERASLNAIRFTVEGLRELPGRKSLILFSDSLPLHERSTDEIRGSGLPAGDLPGARIGSRPAGDTHERAPSVRRAERSSVADPLRESGEMAARASVVIYAIDTRGVQAFELPGADNVGGMSLAQINSSASAPRLDDFFEAQEGPASLAAHTGGFLVRNANDITRALGRIMEDLKGYYLIGYRPGGETFDRRFHRISLRVRNRPDLRVRSRRGFYGAAEEGRPAPRAEGDRFRLALVSPFAAGDIGVQFTPVFADLPEAGSFLRALLHIDAGGLTFTPEADGWEKSDLVLRGILFGDNGRIAEEHRHAFTLHMRGETLRRVRARGLEYAFNMPVRKPGAYQFRVALLDRASSRVGSAGQFVEVPDLKKNRLAVSGIVMAGEGEAEAADGGARRSAADAREGEVESRGDPGASPAVRRFRQNTLFDYAYTIYNARTKKGGPPQLFSQTRLFRDGQPVFTGRETPIQADSQTDPKRVTGGGRISLGAGLPPGEYVPQVTVRDTLAKGEHAAATQWIDFEVVK